MPSLTGNKSYKKVTIILFICFTRKYMQKSNFFVKTFSKKNDYFYTKNVFQNDLKTSFFKRALAHQRTTET